MTECENHKAFTIRKIKLYNWIYQKIMIEEYDIYLVKIMIESSSIIEVIPRYILWLRNSTMVKI